MIFNLETARVSEIANIIIWHGKRHDGDLTILQVEEFALLLTLVFFEGSFEQRYEFQGEFSKDRLNAILDHFDKVYLQKTMKARDELIAVGMECLH